MSLDGCVTVWAILGGIGVGKAMSGGVVAGFDGGEPGRLDGKAGGRVELADEGPDAGEVVGVKGVGGSRVSGKKVGWIGVRMISEAERETP